MSFHNPATGADYGRGHRYPTYPPLARYAAVGALALVAIIFLLIVLQ
jgi:hypothetical protein